MMNNKVALITGASRGIGLAISHELAKNGIYVIGTATTEDNALKITSELHAKSLPGEGIVLDVTKHEQLENLLARLTAESKLPSILVNNAGITQDNLLLRMNDDEWYKVIDTNLNAIFRLTKACIKYMFRSRWGRVINIGSVVGAAGNAGQVNYSAAKAGVVGFSKSLAQEIGSRGITVNVVAPGFIDTDMTQSLPDAIKNEMIKRIALRKLGTAEDVAHTVAFLASEHANYITGQTLHVNGGL